MMRFADFHYKGVTGDMFSKPNRIFSMLLCLAVLCTSFAFPVAVTAEDQLENLALGKTVKSNPGGFGGCGPEKAVDGNMATSYNSQPGNGIYQDKHWIYVDLEEDHVVSYIDAYTGKVGYVYEIYYLMDGADPAADTWQQCEVVGQETKDEENGGYKLHYELPEPFTARYVKLASITEGSDTRSKLKELQVMGKMVEKTPSELQADMDAVTLEILLDGQEAAAVTNSLKLPMSGENGSTITWTSDKPEVIAVDGTITQPEGADVTVTLTATFAYEGIKAEKTYSFTVKAKEEQTQPSEPADLENLALGKTVKSNPGGFGGYGPEKAVDGNMATSYNSQPGNGIYQDKHWIYVDLLKDSEIHCIDAYTGKAGYVYEIYYLMDGADPAADTWQQCEVVGQETKDEENGGYKLHYELLEPFTARYVKLASITEGSDTRSKLKELQVMGTVELDSDFQADIDAVTLESICGEQDPMALVENITLPTRGAKGAEISWESSNEKAIKADGTVTQSADEEQLVTLTATFTKGGFTKKKTFVVKVKQIPWDISLDTQLITAELIKGENRHLAMVKADLTLPEEVGTRGTQVEWSAQFKRLLTEITMEEILTLSGDEIGKVTRPKEGTFPITLTAKLTGMDESIAELSFDIVIQGEDVPLPELSEEETSNLALFGSAVGNGSWSTTPAKYANDNDMSTSFGSAYRPEGVPTILYINLGNAHYVNKVRLYSNSNSTGYTFSYSNDGVEDEDWITLGSVNQGVNSLYEMEFPTIEAKYVRAVAHSTANVYIPEFEIYGAKIPETVQTDNLTQGCEGGSSRYEAETRISSLFDMDLDSYWQPVVQEDKSSWAIAHLGYTRWFTDVVLYDDSPEHTYQIYVSNDAKTWTPIGAPSLVDTIGAPYEKRLIVDRMEARYLKVETEAGMAPKLYEFQVYDNVKGTIDDNLALGKKVTASVPALTSENAASKMVDNNAATEFLTELGVPFDITIDLGQTQTADTVVVQSASKGHISKYGVSVSADGTVWTEVTDVANGDDGAKVYTFTADKIRYVKVNVYEIQSTPCGFAEIGVYYNGASSSDVDRTYDTLSVPSVIDSGYQLPMDGIGEAEIVWDSTNPSTISVQNGITVIMQPQYNTVVTLTATISAGEESRQKIFHVTVRGTDGDKPSGGNGGNGGGGSRPSGGGAAVVPPSGDTTNPEPVDPDKPYKQELQGHWGEEEINALIEKGVVQGDGASLHLSDSVTRAEFTAMLLRMFGIEGTSASDVSFNDVTGTEWYADIMRTAFEAGILSGYDNSLRPEDTITREEAVKIADNLSIYLGKEMSKAELTFRDGEEISDWAMDSVEKCVGTGIIVGDETGAFRPQSPLSRDEAMVIIYRLGDYFSYL